MKTKLFVASGTDFSGVISSDLGAKQKQQKDAQRASLNNSRVRESHHDIISDESAFVA